MIFAFLCSGSVTQLSPVVAISAISNPKMDTEFEVLQTPYSNPILDNPWQVAFDTVYAHGFSLHTVELLADNTWAINGLATLPSDAGIVVFLVNSSAAVRKISNITNEEIRPFLISNTDIFSADGNIDAIVETRRATIEGAADSILHNFSGIIDNPQMKLSVSVTEDSNANEDSHLAVVKIVSHRFNFSTPYYDFVIGVGFIHNTMASLDSIHVGTVRIFDPKNGLLTSSATAVTANHLPFVKNYAFKLLQVEPGQNYLILQFVLQNNFSLPIFQTSSSHFFIGSSASTDRALWSHLCDSEQTGTSNAIALLKSCSSTSTDTSLHICELFSVPGNDSTMESVPMTVPITYNLVLPTPFMQNDALENNALDTYWLFVHLALHATQSAPNQVEQKVYMGWNLKIPFKQSLTPCFDEILTENTDSYATDNITLTLFKGSELTPLNPEWSDSADVERKVNINYNSIADIRAISILESLQTLALIGVDNLYQPPGLDMLFFVDITLIHVKSITVFNKIKTLLRLGLAYSVEDQRLVISKDLKRLCQVPEICFLDPILANQSAENYVEPIFEDEATPIISNGKSRLHSLRRGLDSSPNSVDIQWVNDFIKDPSADPRIATDFLDKIQNTLDPNFRYRRVLLLDTRIDMPNMVNTNQIYRVITLASYKTTLK